MKFVAGGGNEEWQAHQGVWHKRNAVEELDFHKDQGVELPSAARPGHRAAGAGAQAEQDNADLGELAALTAS